MATTAPEFSLLNAGAGPDPYSLTERAADPDLVGRMPETVILDVRGGERDHRGDGRCGPGDGCAERVHETDQQ